MSESTQPTTTTPRKRKPSHVRLSSVYATVASRKSIDTTRAAKLVRARMRSNFDTMVKLSPNIKQSKQSANDGNRWPDTITRKAAEFALNVKGK